MSDEPWDEAAFEEKRYQAQRVVPALSDTQVASMAYWGFGRFYAWTWVSRALGQEEFNEWLAVRRIHPAPDWGAVLITERDIEICAEKKKARGDK